MPKGPKGEKRPGDVIGAAVMVARIATGEIQESGPKGGKNYTRKGGKIGGAKRAEVLSSDQRSQIARLAAQARWKKK